MVPLQFQNLHFCGRQHSPTFRYVLREIEPRHSAQRQSSPNSTEKFDKDPARKHLRKKRLRQILQARHSSDCLWERRKTRPWPSAVASSMALLGGAASLAPDKMVSLSEAFIHAISVDRGQAKLSQPPVSAAVAARSGNTSAPAHTNVRRNLAIRISGNGHHDIRRLDDS